MYNIFLRRHILINEISELLMSMSGKIEDEEMRHYSQICTNNFLSDDDLEDEKFKLEEYILVNL